MSARRKAVQRGIKVLAGKQNEGAADRLKLLLAGRHDHRNGEYVDLDHVDGSASLSRTRASILVPRRPCARGVDTCNNLFSVSKSLYN